MRALVAAPRQRNTDEEKAAIKAGKSAAEIWPDEPVRSAQKDTDARWMVKTSKGKHKADGTVQRGIAIPVFGYIGIRRAEATIVMANIAYSMGRWRWWQGRSVSA